MALDWAHESSPTVLAHVPWPHGLLQPARVALGTERGVQQPEQSHTGWKLLLARWSRLRSVQSRRPASMIAPHVLLPHGVSHVPPLTATGVVPLDVRVVLLDVWSSRPCWSISDWTVHASVQGSASSRSQRRALPGRSGLHAVIPGADDVSRRDSTRVSASRSSVTSTVASTGGGVAVDGPPVCNPSMYVNVLHGREATCVR